MQVPPLPKNEKERLEALLRYEILDTEAEEEFDDLVELASQICDAPISLVSLIDAERQWFKAKKGMEETETPRELAFCGHTLEREDVLEVENAREDERFKDNPLVKENPNIRFYAGMPLRTSEGYNLGTLCVIDQKPKKLTEAQRFALRTLGRQVMAQLEIRRKFRELQEATRAQQYAQKRALESEKMATLGQLVANIAHEINTPLGAIRSSADSTDANLREIIPGLPTLVQNLSKPHFDTFEALVRMAGEPVTHQSSKEKRHAKYDLIEQLEEQGLRNPETIADYLVSMDVHIHPELFEPLLKLDNAKEVIAMAGRLALVLRSNQTVREAGERAASIVTALKTFARSDQEDSEPERVAINKGIKTTLTLYQNLLKKGVEVKTYFDELPLVQGYPNQLVQVWTNLIKNAIQAMNQRGILTIRTRQEEDHVRVEIHDTGEGIPEDIQEQVFAPFFTTKDIGEGSGLGLDISKKIVEAHYGHIWFETSPETGTAFFVELPLEMR